MTRRVLENCFDFSKMLRVHALWGIVIVVILAALAVAVKTMIMTTMALCCVVVVVVVSATADDNNMRVCGDDANDRTLVTN